MRAYFGIDPGLSGAVATLLDYGDRTESRVWDLPIVGEGPAKCIDADALMLDLEEARTNGDGVWHCVAAIEKAQVIPIRSKKVSPFAGAVPNLRKGIAYGQCLSVLQILGARIYTPPPGSWKRNMGLTGKGKEGSRELAMRLFPELREELRRKKDHDRSESLLLVEWVRRTFSKEVGG